MMDASNQSRAGRADAVALVVGVLREYSTQVNP